MSDEENQRAPKVGDLWELPGDDGTLNRWACVAVGPVWADFDNGCDTTCRRLDEMAAKGCVYVNGHACRGGSPSHPDAERRSRAGGRSGGPCVVWRFGDAPDDYQRLSPHGGDEDWVGFVPTGMDPPLWMEEGTAFGCCSVSEHVVLHGRVFIGAHA